MSGAAGRPSGVLRVNESMPQYGNYPAQVPAQRRQCITIGRAQRRPGAHATHKCAFEHTTQGRSVIEFVGADLVHNGFTEG